MKPGFESARSAAPPAERPWPPPPALQTPVASPGQTPAGRPPSRARHGHTLLELVAVLAIIALLAAALVPAVMKQMDEAARTREVSDLGALAAGLESHIRRSHNIPSHTNWAAALSDDVEKAVLNITTTPRGYARVFLIDPNLRIAGTGLPYTQTTNGTVRPVSPRVILLTSLGAGLPVSSSVPSAAEFNAIWNTPRDAKPGTWAGWSGNPQDLVIRRVNLEPLFHRLVLINNDTLAAGRYAIDGTNSASVPTDGLGWSAYYLDGTVIGLHDTNGVLQTRQILNSDVSYVFELGHWWDQVHFGRMPRSRGLQFAGAAWQFMGTVRNPGADFGASQQSVVDQMYFYLFIYTLWAGDNPCFARSGSVNLTQVPQNQSLQEAQTRLDVVTQNLIK